MRALCALQERRLLVSYAPSAVPYQLGRFRLVRYGDMVQCRVCALQLLHSQRVIFSGCALRAGGAVCDCSRAIEQIAQRACGGPYDRAGSRYCAGCGLSRRKRLLTRGGGCVAYRFARFIERKFALQVCTAAVERSAPGGHRRETRPRISADSCPGHIRWPNWPAFSDFAFR